MDTVHKQLLKALFELYLENQGDFVNSLVLTGNLNISDKELEINARYLREKGYLKCGEITSDDFGLKITQKGIDFVKKLG
jgi:hypothetical protein